MDQEALVRIAIIGGHGKVAMLLAPLLVERGHGVSSLIRDEAQIPEVSGTGATPVVADAAALDHDALAGHLAGHDAVVWTAGAGGGDPDRTRAVDRDAAIRSMDAAMAAGVDRYVMVSYFGASLDHGLDPDDSFFAYADAKAHADEHLRRSGLAWTILGPSALTDGPGSARIELGEDGVEGSSVDRADVARVAAAVIDRPETSRCTIEFNGGDTPIDEALAQVQPAG